MCRFQCTAPPSLHKFTVPSKCECRDETGFVRNRNVNFFSPDSSDESEDEMTAEQVVDQRYATNDDESSLNSATEDSGIEDDGTSSNSGSASSVTSEARPLKSIMRSSGASAAPKSQRVSFADRWGQQLVVCRTIPGRSEHSLMAELVEIDEAVFSAHSKMLGSWMSKTSNTLENVEEEECGDR